MSKYALFAVIGLLVGLGLGLVIGNSLWSEAPRQVSGAPAIEDGAPDPTGTSDPLQASALDTHEEGSRPNPVKPDERRADPRPLSSLAELIAKADVPPVPTGDGKITGHVLTQTGQPLADVAITAMPEYPEERGWWEGTVEERIAARIRTERWSELAKRETKTAADGSYTVTVLDPSAQYFMSAKADGWTFQQKQRTRTSRHQAGEVCDFTAEESLTVEVTVLMPDGSKAKNGMLRYGLPGERGSSGTNFTKGAGKLTLKPGKFEVRAVAGTHEELRSDAIDVVVESGKKLEPLSLHLKVSPGVFGTVKTDAFGASASQARVYLQTNPPAEAPEAAFKNERNMASEWPHSGAFSFLELAPGNYRVLLVLDHRVCDWKDVVISDATVEVTLTVPEPKREDYIVIRVYAPDGKPADDISFNLTRRTGNNSSSGGARQIRQADGSYWLFKGEWDSKASSNGSEEAVKGWWIIAASSIRWGSKEVRYEFSDTHDLEIRFVEPANVTLTVDNFNEHKLRDKLRWDLQSAAAKEEGRNWRPSYGRDNPAYASPFKLGPVEPGEYSLILSYSADSYGSRELLRQRVSLAAGENALTATVPVTYTLTITADNERDLRRMEIRIKDSTPRLNSYRDEVKDGKLTLECIAAGTYTLKSSNGEMDVTVSSDTTIKFEPRAYDCIVLTMTTGGPMEGLGFTSGDKLIEVDGAKVADMDLAWALIQTSMAKEETTWKVLRGGLPTDVTFDGRELMKLMKDEEEQFRPAPGYQTG